MIRAQGGLLRLLPEPPDAVRHLYAALSDGDVLVEHPCRLDSAHARLALGLSAEATRLLAEGSDDHPLRLHRRWPVLILCRADRARRFHPTVFAHLP